MTHLIIGTSGHVDHGKTQLTLALTGTNTDRLAEEQRRGLTIEPGFAKLVLPNGQTASIVDVPGHERFIKNMLAGASGVDAVLLTVAADEGFMPQTQEHLDILTLLCVCSGVIVITKVDLVDDAWLADVMEDTRARVKCTFLESAPMVAVSARTGEGIAALTEEIARLAARTPVRACDRPCRLPVDRVFSRPGYGVIVTGTLVDGELTAGQSVMLYPQQKLLRVRELQNHDTRFDSLQAGMRAAVNVTGAEKGELYRGAVLAEPDSLQLSDRIAVHMTVNAGAPFGVKNASRLHFYQGTQERLCKVRLMEKDALSPGESGYAQLFFDEPVAARGLDRFILRFYSPVTTIGGGVILDMEAKRLKRNRPETLMRLHALHASPESRVLQLIADAECRPVTREALRKRSGLSASAVEAALLLLTGSGALVAVGDGLLAADVLMRVWEIVSETLAAYHAQNPLSPGMPLGELRERAFGVPQKTADALLSYYCAQGRLRISGPNAAMIDHVVRLTPEQAKMQDALLALYEGYGFISPDNDAVAAQFADNAVLYRQMFTRMCEDNALVPLTMRVTVHAAYYEKAKACFVGMYEESNTVTLAAFRTALGVSRKYAQMYLERFDADRISKLIGDARILLKK